MAQEHLKDDAGLPDRREHRAGEGAGRRPGDRGRHDHGADHQAHEEQ